MQCGNRRKFGANRSKTKRSKNRQSMTSVYWRVGLKGLNDIVCLLFSIESPGFEPGYFVFPSYK
jgi:hypothetical protein